SCFWASAAIISVVSSFMGNASCDVFCDY
ncbi:protein translation elongation factor G (EF-G), partial [Weissella paramesenteroides]|nr:protein translation elongation factor G (EF-G) [Weissella paramesenteroides]MCT0259777.1 protein translation elongation factor G (EF-G) [Weissella paramesenteroides]